MSAMHSTILYERLSQLINAMGFALIKHEWCVEGKRSIFRLYIDSLTGVSIADCAKVSQQVSAFLDVENIMQDKYVLEVSSPGIGSSLLTRDDYNPHVGSWINVYLQMSVRGDKQQYKGRLLLVTQDAIHLSALSENAEPEQVVLLFNAIEKANVMGSLN